MKSTHIRESLKIIIFYIIIVCCYSQICLPQTNYGNSIGLCQCMDNYVKIDNVCTTCKVPNCRLCAVGLDTQCDVCSSGYVLDDLTKSICLPAISSQPVCASASCGCSPYQVNNNGVCMGCAVSNCLLCSSQNVNECDVCKKGYVLDQLTSSSCVPAVSSQPVCSTGSSGCSPFQINFNGICMDCAVSHCKLCSIQSVNACDVCAGGYVLDELTKSTCVLAVSSQPVCSSSSCSCSPYQVKVDGTCQNCAVSNCKVCSIQSINECDVCASGFILDSLTKMTCVPALNSSAVCSAASCGCSPFQVKVDGKCSNCAVINCKLCSINRINECDICALGFKLDDLTKNSCVPIMSSQLVCTARSCGCSPYQIKQDGICQSCRVSNCRLCSIDSINQCDICATGYTLDALTKKTCIPAVNSQLVCTTSSCNCTAFQTRVNGVCKSCSIPNCKLCSFDNQNQCDVCSSGYQLDSLTKMQCVPISSSQLYCSASSSSCQCSPYQSRVNGVCKTCRVNKCVLCSISSQNECDVCANGYQLDALTKTTCVPKLNSQLNCTAPSCLCSAFQINIQGSCFNCHVDNCKLCSIDNTEDCDVCQKLYTYNPAKKSCDPPACPEDKIWKTDSCACKEGDYENAQGNCESYNNIKNLGLVLGISIPLVVISAIILVGANLVTTGAATLGGLGAANSVANPNLQIPQSSGQKIIMGQEQFR